MESILAKHTLAKKTMESIGEVLKELYTLKETFLRLVRVILCFEVNQDISEDYLAQ